MPTANYGLVRRTLGSVGGNQSPPPGQLYHGRATTFSALYPIGNAHFFSPGVQHEVLVVFTDGEAVPIRSQIGYVLARAMTVHPLFVHVWAPTERIYVHGHIDPHYRPDLTSAARVEQICGRAATGASSRRTTSARSRRRSVRRPATPPSRRT